MYNRVSSPNSFAIEVRSILGLDCPLFVLTSLKILGRLPFARKIRLEWNACYGTGFSWLTMNRSTGSG